MSTISRALQKSRAQQLPYSVDLYRSENGQVKLKVALFVTLLVVVCLLVTLTFLLIKPLDISEGVDEITAKVVVIDEAETVIDKPKVAQQTQRIKPITPSNTIEKITFSLKPLPIINREPEVKIIQVKTQPKPSPLTPEQGKPQDNILANNEISEIDYGDTPSDLQERFQSALLMVDELDNNSAIKEKPVNDDGRDIHQMDSDLQMQIPPLQYDSHMYSSKQQDRWIRINGEDLKEGQFSHTANIEVVEIQPNRTIFRFGPRSFSLESLENWDGY